MEDSSSAKAGAESLPTIREGEGMELIGMETAWMTAEGGGGGDWIRTSDSADMSRVL